MNLTAVPAQAKPAFATSLALNLYAVSMALPFVLAILIPRPKGLGLSVLLPDFLASCTLLAASIVLGVQTWKSGRWWRYPVGAVAAVLLFFWSATSIRKATDYLSFKLKQRQLEQLVRMPEGGSPEQLAAAGIMSVEMIRPGVILYVEDGEASYQYWGVAYSATGEKPTNSYLLHKLYEWRHIDGHWYKWARHDD